MWLVSCTNNVQSHSKELQRELQKHFVSTIDSSVKVESFRLIRIDTLTDWSLQNEHYTNQARDLQNSIDLYNGNMELFNATDSKVIPLPQDEFDARILNMKARQKNIQSMQASLDSMKLYFQNADRVTPIAYKAVSFIKVRKGDRIFQDSTYAILDTNSKRIVVKKNGFSDFPAKFYPRD